MKHIRKTIPLPDDPWIRHYFPESQAFFDIETTGFSPKNAFVYLIGLALRKQNSIQIDQFLAKSRGEEAEILTAFHKELSSAKGFVTFNGLGFDVPFLKSREQLYRLHGGWNLLEATDLYKLMGNFARLFHLPDKKQKSFERFLGIDRDDALSGGELIPVYFDYEKNHKPESERLLLVHNFEDVLGMTKLLSLLSYADFFSQPKHVLTASKEKSRSFSGLEQTELLLTLKAPLPFPKQLLYQGNFCCLKCFDDSARLLVKTFCGELKFYYENYKDYYYLPEEDMAIHKSVAAFVDPKRRKKATAATCYTKKSGLFLPQKKNLFSPCFGPEKKSATHYFELTDEFLSDLSALNTYASHLSESLLGEAKQK